MASLEYIHNNEEILIAADKAAVNLMDGVRFELIHTEIGLYPENRDSWGTVYVNAKQLQRSIAILVANLENHFPD
jgi:hypothetical protein